MNVTSDEKLIIKSKSSDFALGNEHLRNQRYTQAIICYEKAIIETPSLSATINFNLQLAIKYSKNSSSRIIDAPAKTVVASGFADGLKTENIQTTFLPEFNGRIDKASQNSIAGWAVNCKTPQDIFDLEILIDGIHFCHVKNNDARNDLLRLGKSKGKGGFSVSIPNNVLSEQSHTVTVKFPDGTILASRDIDVTPIDISNDIYLLPAEEDVSVIVPIFNAIEDVKICIERLMAHTKQSVDIILINDASSDPNIAELLTKSETGNIRVFHNSTNLGFTKTVNRGIELAGARDVILLNSDARVTPRWIEGFKRALSTDHKIGTVTAMSNRAGAFSAPNIGNENDLPNGIFEREYAVAFRRRSVGLYPTVPTGNGFCMYIRRSCINDIGSLDSDAFPRGYGEENDFCMRARANGWRNIIDDRTYVFHDRSKSFADEKHELMKSGRKVINDRYPDYTSAIKIFNNSPKINSARLLARKALQDTLQLIKPRVLYVISTVTGGTPQTNRDLMHSLINVIDPWLLRCDSNKITLHKVSKNNDEIVALHSLTEPVDPLTHHSPEYDRVLKNWLAKYDFEIVHIRHLAWHSLSLIKIAKNAGAKVINSFHDFYTICPTVKLVDENSIYCKGNCTRSEGQCAPQLWPAHSLPALKHRWVHVWRKKFSTILNLCDAFVSTSQSAMDTIRTGLDLNQKIPFEVIEHGRDFKKFRAPDPLNIPSLKIKILAPGNLGSAKGLNVIKKLLEIDKEGLLEFHILGTLEELIQDERIVVHGKYNREEFLLHVEKIQPHIGVVFSIWDETWCHTLTELWASGLPAIVFDYGTVALRVKKSGAGWIGSSDVVMLYESIIKDYCNKDNYLNKLKYVEEWQNGDGMFNSINYMSLQYLNLYRSQTGDNIKDIVGVVCPADASKTHAPGSTHIRIWEKTHNTLFRKIAYLRLTPEELIAGIKLGKIRKAIIQRNALTEENWKFIKLFVQKGELSYVFDLDDDLLDVPKDKDPDGIYLRYRDVLVDIIKNATHLLVSTHSLYEKYRDINNTISIEPNFLSRECWLEQSRAENSENLKALYFGSYTHAEDLNLLLPALENVIAKYPNFKLKLIGIDSRDHANYQWIEKISIPNDRKNYPDFVELLKKSSMDCFLGLAPLEENKFNAYKSDLKIQEYRALGLNVLASNVGPYRNCADVTLVENDIDQWTVKILECIENRTKKLSCSKVNFFCEDSFDLKIWSSM